MRFTSLQRLKLGQRFEISAIEVADVLHAVTHHGKTRQSQTEGEAGVLFGVNTAVAQNVGVDHAAGAKLQPAGVLAGGAALAAADLTVDVKLKAGLDEGEKSGTESDLNVTSEHLLPDGGYDD